MGTARTHGTWRDDALDVDRLIANARAAGAQGKPVCIFATAFALVQLLDAFGERHVESLPLHPGSRVMETGGFKGRTRSVERAALYAQLAQTFALPEERIVAEYGMTELTSQYYDAAPGKERVKRAPRWMRPRVVGSGGQTLPPGVAGTLVHVDLANRSSCVAIQTQDVGVATPERHRIDRPRSARRTARVFAGRRATAGRTARVTALQALPAGKIVRAIAGAAERWSDGDFPPRVRALDRICERTGYSAPVAEYALDRLFFSVTEAQLRATIASELGCVEILDEFAARAGRPAALAVPIGRVCIIFEPHDDRRRARSGDLCAVRQVRRPRERSRGCAHLRVL